MDLSKQDDGDAGGKDKDMALDDTLGVNDDCSRESDSAAGSDFDFSDVKGQDELIDAIVLGAAGGHNILMLGEPGLRSQSIFTSEKNDNRSLSEGIRVCVKGEKCTWLLSGLFQLR